MVRIVVLLLVLNNFFTVDSETGPGEENKMIN